MTDPRRLLGRDAARGVRRLTRTLLRQADQQAERLGGDDPEALHRFRVSVRRLRAFLGAFDTELALPRRRARRLKRLAASTGASRDAEVAVVRIRAWAEGLGPDQVAGAAWLCDRLADASTGPAGNKALKRQWRRFARNLRRDLRGGAMLGVPLDGIYSARIGAHAAELAAALSVVRSEADQNPAHRARIAAKRLRYLIMPLEAALAEAVAAARGLAALQDSLGNMHDTDILACRIAALLTEGAAPPEAVAGLTAVAALAEGERAALFRSVRAAFIADGGAVLLAPLEALRARLETHGPVH